MDEKIFRFNRKEEFYAWLKENHAIEKECYLICKRGKPVDSNILYYLDAVEAALCFGWIDSTQKRINGILVQRFSPRNSYGPWTELNKQRVRRLIQLGLMDSSGLSCLPPMGPRSFKVPDFLVEEMKKNKCYSIFKRFPPLYQRVRAYNLLFMYNLDRNLYQKSLAHFLEMTKKGLCYGEWDDYGRLSHD